MVSHELRTPLNAILGWVRLLRGGRLDNASAREGLVTIERNAKSQAQLIEDLLDVSRIVSGKMRLALTQVELASIIDAALAAIRPEAEAKGIKIETSIERAKLTIPGDPDRLQQVLGNYSRMPSNLHPRVGESMWQ